MPFPHSTPATRRRVIAAFAIAAAALGSAATARAADFTLSGMLRYNTDVVQIGFDLAAPTAVLLYTDSWQAGLNFDPTLAVFDAASTLLTIGDDTPDPADLRPGQGGFDGYVAQTFAAGRYLLTLTASGNDARGPTFADGFSLAGTTPIAIADWNQPSYDINANDQKGSFWQVHLNGVGSAALVAAPVPEPGAWAMLMAGLSVVVVLLRRKVRYH